MKKLLFLPLLLITLFLGTSIVKADTYTYTSFYNYIEDIKVYLDAHPNNVANLIAYYEDHYSDDYPYYYVSINYQDYSTSTCNSTGVENCSIALMYSSSPYVSRAGSYSAFKFTSWPPYNNTDYPINSRPYYISMSSSGTITDYSSTSYPQADSYRWPKLINSNNPTNGHLLAITSNGLIYSPSNSALDVDKASTTIIVPSYSSTNFNFNSFQINEGSLFPDYYSLTDGSYSPSDSNYYTEVNLNDYAYIVLSLKNYNATPSSITFYSLGSLCITPVYDYGMKQKFTYFEGYQTQGCTANFSSYSPVDFYVLDSDLTNHAVYYIKSYSSEITNKVKIPTSIFDITYVSTANANNPQVVIEGRSYPVIPFDNLTDTANKSTNEGYISGRVCALGDVNCQTETMGMDISDLFTSPLTLLQTLWTSITSIFTIITTFITILPPTLQVFLYTSFMLGIILGIIKIIL